MARMEKMIDQQTPQLSTEELARMNEIVEQAKKIIDQNQKVKKPVKPKMVLSKTDKEGLMIGTRSDGRKCSVRTDRSRYFFPNEWNKFINTVKESKRLIFETQINTGGRIEEILNIEPRDFDFERCNLTLRVTKKRAAKGEQFSKKRTFTISTQFAAKCKKFIKQKGLQENERLFKVSKQAVNQLLKRSLVKAGFKDYYQFSTHNLRKSHGNFLKALHIPAEEICLRLGHDFNTYLKHYGSSNIFSYDDLQQIRHILGDLYQKQTPNFIN